MMISWQTGIVLFALIGAVAGRIVAGSPRNHAGGMGKYLFGDRFGWTLILTFGILLTMASLGWGIGRVYIIHSSTDWSVNWTLGSPTFKFPNGNEVDIQPHAVINNTAESLVLENVIYGNGEYRDNVVILPNSANTFDHGVIHYFFDDHPPQSIQSKTGQATQWWLHRM